MQTERFRYVTALHGNEPKPVLGLEEMGVGQVVANPRALAKNVRFIEKDMNASFGTTGITYEENRAREVLVELAEKGEKIVIDMHTFSCDSPPFAIVVDEDLIPFAASLEIAHVVYMKHNIKSGHALINHVYGISVEVGRHDDPESLFRSQELVRRLESGLLVPTEVTIYEVFGRIMERGDYRNFEFDGEFFPVLYGETAYFAQGFYGLKAKKIAERR